jgi:hypothetical protein
MKLLRSVLFVALAVTLMIPASASAASVSSSDGKIAYSPGARERNFVIISGGGSDEVVFTESGPARLDAGAGCVAQTGYVSCRVTGVSRIAVDLGDGNDQAALLFGGQAEQPLPVNVIGGSGTDGVSSAGNLSLDGMVNDGPAGIDYIGGDVENLSAGNADTNDTLSGNEAGNRLESPGGSDVFEGGDGPDVISAQDVRRDLEDSGQVAPDRVNCGPGNDVAVVDDRDAVGGDCEIVIRRDGVARLTKSSDIFRAPRPGLTIFGFGGDDDIAAGGAKSVSGGSGDDRITLGSAVDITANGDTGDDRIYGLVGRDRINGGAGNDKLYGERSNDRIDGGNGRDGIDAGRGDDSVRVRDGFVDRVKCGTGRDTVRADRIDRVARDCERVSRH